MNRKLNLNGKLDFTDIDLTAPDSVINELLNQLPGETNGMIYGKVQSYSGHVMSYTKSGISPIASVFGTTDKNVDIYNNQAEKY